MILSDALGIPLIAAVLITLSIGSNDTSNSLGICIGCGIISFRRAMALFSLFATLGILIQGRRVMSTVGKDLLALDHRILTVALLTSAVFILAANWRRLPISTHQVIIGSLSGSGLAFGADLNYDSLAKIVVSWFISPLSALLASLAIYWLMEKTISRLPVFQIGKLLSGLLLMSGLVVAYTTGANELATILGPVIYAGMLSESQALPAGAVLLSLGAWFLSRRVIETIGHGITALDPYSGFAAQFGAGGCVLFFTALGMPVSTTYCVIGGIAGVGLFKGARTLKMELLRRIGISAVLTPIVACLVAMAVSRVALLP
ncbi:MAG: phosphate permease [Deltaproteobacteria bacterium RIFOXYD12_FULL_57_12]|nr:MAG: phosphate permease [Deltaproteobacteria bacterium RIFOXYD12_FULL_57_12]